MPAKRNPHTIHWRGWYSLQSWRNRRAGHLRVEPWCRHCRERGVNRLATVADHIEPHRGDYTLFATGRLQSLCADCHGRKPAEQNRGYRSDIDDSGWPTDPRHPSNRKSQ
jgi:5-methylcytosine-specific restriction enzyme A